LDKHLAWQHIEIDDRRLQWGAVSAVAFIVARQQAFMIRVAGY
jgi:hypothetical protein